MADLSVGGGGVTLSVAGPCLGCCSMHSPSSNSFLFFLLLSSFFHTLILSAPPPPLSYHHSRITAPSLLSTLTVNNCSCFSCHHFFPPIKTFVRLLPRLFWGGWSGYGGGGGGDVQTRQTFKLTFLSYVRICTYCSNTIFKMFSVVININRWVEKCRKGRKSNGLKWF